MFQRPVDLFLGNLVVRSREYKGRFPLGDLKQLAVANDVGHAKAGNAGLPGAEEFSGTAEFKIELGDLKPITRVDHGVEAALAFLGDFSAVHQNAVRLGGAPSNAPAKLMELRQAEAIGVLDHHDACVGNVDAYFDYRSRDQHIDLATLKLAHHMFLVAGIETSVQQADMQI